jgi:ligand-binding SRPBCC domain-containing protein
MSYLQVSEIITAPRLEVFDYLVDPSKLPELLGPAIEVEVRTPELPLKRGSEVHLFMTRMALTQSVRFRVEDVLRGSRLTYRQVEGLFRQWTHTMKFEDHGSGMTLVTDLVDYEVPLGILGLLADDLLLKADMQKLLVRRLKKVRDHFEAVAVMAP